MHDRYLYTNDPFEPFLTIEGMPTFNNPNPVIYIPQAIIEQNVGSVDLTYQMTEHDTLSFTGGKVFSALYTATSTRIQHWPPKTRTLTQAEPTINISFRPGSPPAADTALPLWISGMVLARSGIQAA